VKKELERIGKMALDVQILLTGSLGSSSGYGSVNNSAASTNQMEIISTA